MSISKHFLALALSACVAAPVLAQESLIDVYRRALENDPAHSRSRGHVSRERRGETAGAQRAVPGVDASAAAQRITSRTTRGGALSPDGHTDRHALDLRPRRDRLEHQPDADALRLEPIRDAAAGRQAGRARRDATTRPRKQHLLLRVATALLRGPCGRGQSRVGRRGSAKASRGSSSKRSAASRWASSRSPTCSSRKPALTTPSPSRSRRSACSPPSHEHLREIIGEIVTDLAARPTICRCCRRTRPNAEEWVQTALRQNLALTLEPPGDRDRARRHRDSARQPPADVEPVGRLHRRHARSHADVLPRRRCPPTIFDRRNCPTAAAGRSICTFPLFTGGLNRSRIQQSVYQAPRGNRSARAHRAANGAADSRRLSRRDLRDLARARAAPSRRVESHGVARHGGGLRGRHANDRRRAGRRRTTLRRAETKYSRSRYDYILNILRLKQAAGSLSVAGRRASRRLAAVVSSRATAGAAARRASRPCGAAHRSARSSSGPA